jgi:hypothetical protein
MEHVGFACLALLALAWACLSVGREPPLYNFASAAS